MKTINEVIKERELAKIASENKIKEDGNRKKENIKKKYLKEKYINTEKNINCCPNKILCCFSNCCKKYCSNCCCDFYISYYSFFVLSLLMSLGLHVFDVGSDIFVLVDLYGKDTKLFSTCLGIIILSFFASSMISCFGQTKSDVRPGEIFKNTNIHQNSCKKRLLNLLLGFFQFGIFIEAYYSIKIGEKTHTFVWSRVIEGLVESCPQSLFQLFIVLKGAETFSFFDMTKYYISIIISLLNLSMVLVTFEIYRYEYERRKGHAPIKGITKITMFSPYGLVLTLYRLTEISSRMGLLGCIGYMYNGYAILIALLFDYLLSIILNFLILKCKVSTGSLLFFSFSNILFLPAYWKPFTTRLPGNTDEEYYYDIYHWLSKYLNNGIISVLLITKLINDTNNLSFTIISISSISCFILNIPLLYFVILWNRSTIFTLDFFYIKTCWCPKRNNLNKFKPLVCCKHCCSFPNKLMDVSSNKIMDVSSNKIDILSEDDIII